MISEEKDLDRQELLDKLRQRQEETGQLIPPGVVYATSEPEFIGRIPVRTDIEVLPADDANQLKIGWHVITYNGCEVTKVGSKEPITKRFGLRPGMMVTAWDMEWVVVRSGLFSLALEREKSIGILEFKKDARKCWACPMIINRRLLQSPSKSL